ncbi:FkbM family methyltransferase [Amycolatopsis sp. WAC 04182]|uniref:FkbM family methyltransferase n=1 Tax=Amycolatopsis sp. WAC 04182 TaxID=2203198 RepID=UPI000F77B81F|nr:FkbM family methyltransferase [Amycolatopsis sp. WAC 04182]RSN53089.1 FkbM family methyltransferase [Amycolatopsis sp. WAC 04182]
MPLRRLPNGWEVAQVDPGEAAFLYREIFVERSYLRDGFPNPTPEVIFDIGANIGMASMFFAETFPDAFIVAAEPAPEPFAALTENFRRHVRGGVTHNVALADREGTRRLGYYPNATAESGFYADQDSETELARRLLVERGLSPAQAEAVAESRHKLSYIDCRTTTVSALIREHAVEHVDLLKIDVEKSEIEVLAGIEEPDWGRIRNVVMEIHDFDDRLHQVLTLLKERGFTCETEQETELSASDIFMIYATKPV